MAARPKRLAVNVRKPQNISLLFITPYALYRKYGHVGSTGNVSDFLLLKHSVRLRVGAIIFHSFSVI